MLWSSRCATEQHRPLEGKQVRRRHGGGVGSKVGTGVECCGNRDRQCHTGTCSCSVQQSSTWQTRFGECLQSGGARAWDAPINTHKERRHQCSEHQGESRTVTSCSSVPDRARTCIRQSSAAPPSSTLLTATLTNRSDREDWSEEQGCSPGNQRRQPRIITGAGLGEPPAAWSCRAGHRHRRRRRRRRRRLGGGV